MHDRRVRQLVQRHGRGKRRPERVGEVRTRLAGRYRPSAPERHARARPCRGADDAAAGAGRHDRGERVLVRVTRVGDAVVHGGARAAGGDRRARGARRGRGALRVPAGEPVASEPGRRGALRVRAGPGFRPARASSGSPWSATRSRAQRFGSSGSTGSDRDVRDCACARPGAGSASRGMRRASAGAASTATPWSSTAAGCGGSAPRSSSRPGLLLSGWRRASIGSGSMRPIGPGTADDWHRPASGSARSQGRMFWLSRKTLSGSHSRLSATSRSALASP